MGTPVTLTSGGNQANPAGAEIGTTANPLVTTLSSSGAQSISGTYRRATAVSATPGDGVLVTGVTTAGTVNLTLVNGGSLSISVPLGSSILPLAVTAATLGTAVGGTFQSLFFI